MNIYELSKIDEFEKLDFWQLKKIEELTETYDRHKSELVELKKENEELKDENSDWENDFISLDREIDEMQEEIKRNIKEHKKAEETLSYILEKLEKIRLWDFTWSRW